MFADPCMPKDEAGRSPNGFRWYDSKVWALYDLLFDEEIFSGRVFTISLATLFTLGFGAILMLLFETVFLWLADSESSAPSTALEL